MLTRLQVSGFKNLVDVDVRFGPFTCIAGTNGVGKSNLFDAILFLSHLADHSLIEAAQAVRGGRTAGVDSLFHRVGERRAETMRLSAEMIIPREGEDDFGQEAKATSTFLRYELELAYRTDGQPGSISSLEVLWEQLDPITKGAAHEHLPFPHSAKRWRDSWIKSGRRAKTGFISTKVEEGDRRICMHQDGGSRGNPIKYSADRLPKTVLSGAQNAAESPTALLARREMQSWRLLQLEPTSLRQPDSFNAPTQLGTDGSHLAATLYRLDGQERATGDPAAEGRVYAQVANRLAELFEDVQELWVDRDEKRELLTIHVRTRDETDHPAPALSDGSLRFLALAVLELDTADQGLICLEEPENGVHPDRLPAMLQLLQDITVDVEEPVGSDNPLRQVIINTHSAAVVQQVPEDSLIVAVEEEHLLEDGRSKGVGFRPLHGNWRLGEGESPRSVSLGSLMGYLNPIDREIVRRRYGDESTRRRTVIEREDVQGVLPFRKAG